MPPALIALKAHTYDGRRLKPGDRFTARGIDDARVLKAIGVARTAPAQKAPPPPPRVPPVPPGAEDLRVPLDVLPELEPPTLVDDVPTSILEPEAPPDEEPKRKRTYRRRDLVAEDACNSSD